MADPVTIRESLSILWLLFFIRFDVSFAIINKDAYFSGIERLTLLNPNNLSIAICGHHAVSGNPNAKLCTSRNGILGYTLDYDLHDIFTVDEVKVPLSAKTVLEHHRLISTILHQAEKEMLVQFNVAARATPPKAPRTKPQYYQPEEMDH